MLLFPSWQDNNNLTTYSFSQELIFIIRHFFTLIANLFVPGRPTVLGKPPRHIWVTECARLLSAPSEMCQHWLYSLYAEPVSQRDCETWGDSCGRDQPRGRGRETGTLCRETLSPRVQRRRDFAGLCQ